MLTTIYIIYYIIYIRAVVIIITINNRQRKKNPLHHIHLQITKVSRHCYNLDRPAVPNTNKRFDAAIRTRLNPANKLINETVMTDTEHCTRYTLRCDRLS